jgi:hypothetical protein
MAASTVRTLNINQVAYSTTYPQSGYAMSLAVLGPGAPPVTCAGSTPDAYHACLIDATLGCSSSGWCEKSGYKYHISAICNPGARGQDVCSDYVITAAPAGSGTGSKSYCSTSDAVVRYSPSVVFDPLSSVEECQGWSAL